MAKKNEVKENEELKEDVVQTETTETPEKEEEIENTEVSEQDAKIEENANKLPTVKEVFRDKYDEKVVYNPGDVFIESDEIKDKKPVKVEKGKYKVSKERYAELKRSLYVD